MTKKWMYLRAFYCRSQIGVLCFASCWTAAAAGPHVDHDASAGCSSPSPVNVGPAAMDAYTSPIKPLASSWKTCMHGQLQFADMFISCSVAGYGSPGGDVCIQLRMHATCIDTDACHIANRILCAQCVLDLYATAISTP